MPLCLSSRNFCHEEVSRGECSGRAYVVSDAQCVNETLHEEWRYFSDSDGDVAAGKGIRARCLEAGERALPEERAKYVKGA